MLITNSLIRVLKPHGSLPDGFENVRPDLGLHVMELPSDVPLADWESRTLEALGLITVSDVSFDELVLFVETSSALPVRFSTDLLRALAAVGGVLEHYSSFES